MGKLIELLIDPWQPVVSPGVHRCDLCRLTGYPGTLVYEGTTIQVGTLNLFVPAEGFLYGAPSLIAHCIDAHEYAPPVEFQEAVMNCPPMRSMAYRRAILRNGPKVLILGPKEVAPPL